MTVYHDIIENQYDYSLIMEDDATVLPEFQHSVRALIKKANKEAPEWDIIYMGHCSYYGTVEGCTLSSPCLLPSVHTYCTHGYIVSKKGAQRLVQTLATIDYPIDNELQEHIEQKHLTSFSVVPPVIIQNGRTNTDIPESHLNDNK